jgi:Tfp pilus assembly protein PilO
LGEILDRIKEYLKRYYPADPIRISISKFKFTLLVLLLIIGSAYFYLRSQNAKELELLKQKHAELKLIVQQYFRSMTRVNTDTLYINQIQSEIYKHQRQIKKIEEEINDLRSFWFLD